MESAALPKGGTPSHRSIEEREKLIEQASGLWWRGIRRYSAIGRKLGISPPTAKRYIGLALQRMEQVLDDATGHRASLLGEYQQIIDAAWQDHVKADNCNARVGALRVILDTVKAKAALFEVATERSHQEHSGNIEVIYPIADEN